MQWRRLILAHALLGANLSRTIGWRTRSTFALATFICRNCQVSVPRHRAVRLFGTKATTERLSLRICDLLDVAVGVNDYRSEYTCERYKRKVCFSDVFPPF